MTTDYERAFAFQTWVMARTSTRQEPIPWGTAFFHDGFPLRYDANMAIADRSRCTRACPRPSSRIAA